ncbi:hypothetical protein D3C73_1289430 [compost metagenome]
MPVAPAFIRLESDPAEFGDHDRLAFILVAVGERVLPLIAGDLLVDDCILVTCIPLQELLPGLHIVVQSYNIGDRVLPTVIRNDRTVRVIRLGEMVNALRKFLLSLIM